jgi:hypothetical protein
MMKFRLTDKAVLLPITLFSFVDLHVLNVSGFFTPRNVRVPKKFSGDCGAQTFVRRTAVKDPDDNPPSATVRFKSLSVVAPPNVNLIDKVLYWITSDIGSIFLGGIGLILLLIGRWVLDSSNEPVDFGIAGEQTRANLLAVIAIGAVLLNGLSQLDVQSVLAEKVNLVGSDVTEPIVRSMDETIVDKESVSWVLSSIVTASPASTVVLLIYSEEEKKWRPVAFGGIVSPNLLLDDPKLPAETPIMDRLLRLPSSNSKLRESYLPTLQALPGRTEFTNYLLPLNTQAALLLPLTLSSSSANPAALLLGSNQARSFSPRDIAWCQTAATRIELGM